MKYLAIFLLFVMSVNFCSGGKTNHNFSKEIALRKQKFLQYYASPDRKRTYFYQIAARLALGHEIQKCRKDFMKLLENPSGDMFYSLPMMGCYLHGYEHWTPDIHQKVKHVWKTYLPYRGDTENHWVMWHTSLLLAAQTFPDMSADEWVNGRSSRENYDDALGFLNSWFKTTTTIGQGEFDSPVYIAEYLGPLFLLYDFAEDPILKQRAEMALHWLMADYAIDYLGGAYTGGHSRLYHRDVVNPMQDGAIPFGYIYFGDTLFPKDARRNFSVFGALSGYEIPEVIHRIATDRSEPYISRERKRVRNIIRFGDEMNPPVYKYNYMTKNFSLGSVDGGLQQPIQLHTWDVTYLYGFGKADNLFSLHPYYSYKELGMFFPEELKVMIGEVVKSKGTYNKEDKWTGGSPYERTFQYKNAIIVLYDLAEDTHYKHIDYYFPKSLSRREEDDSGWIFAQGGAAYIAVRPFKPGNWIEEETCFRFRSPHLHNGLITEVADSSDYDSWEDFKTKMRQTRLDLTELDPKIQVSYTTSDGDDMMFRFPDHRVLNGKKIDLSGIPLFDSPYLKGDDRVLRMHHNGEEVTVDFNHDKIIRQAVQ